MRGVQGAKCQGLQPECGKEGEDCKWLLSKAEGLGNILLESADNSSQEKQLPHARIPGPFRLNQNPKKQNLKSSSQKSKGSQTSVSQPGLQVEAV